ncbi:hypothetical protein [Halococcus hamelinensis]|uniref:Uncharacterized protein n=1 Tax=Halococcus hamelinensis 100A6 TaxID=1132509 RepID=M0LZ95_9EURY|nr:hypothetical protein [Halococcus hamelinensis]EMA38478.1 hypothetical protein C447_09997 [Halococcus hamelinensis 100A6]
MITEPVSRAAGFGPLNPTTYGGPEAGIRGPGGPAPPAPSVATRPAGFGPLNATTLGQPQPGIRGGGGKSVGQLLASVDGYALVLERATGETALYAAEDSPSRALTKLSITLNVNARSSWKAEIPSNDELFRWNLADVVIGHNGNRLFHGQMLPSKYSSSSGKVSVGGYGRLRELTFGGEEFTVESGDGCQAINEFWRFIAGLTDGRVRGYCDPPPAGTRREVGPDGFEASGTPMQIATELHNEFGYAFVMDHSDRAGVVHSFRPGTVARELDYWHKDHEVEIDPSKYRNRVVIRGAWNEARAEYYRHEARAPQGEIDDLAAGKLITYRPEPDDELESNEACAVLARSKLDELRGKYSITGSVDAAPVRVVPGYLYPFEEFNAAAPPAARPVYTGVQQVKHTMISDAKTVIDCSEEGGLTQAINQSRNPLAGGIQRQQTGLIEGGMASEAVDAYTDEYPHPYPGGNQ